MLLEKEMEILNNLRGLEEPPTYSCVETIERGKFCLLQNCETQLSYVYESTT